MDGAGFLEVLVDELSALFSDDADIDADIDFVCFADDDFAEEESLISLHIFLLLKINPMLL